MIKKSPSHIYDEKRVDISRQPDGNFQLSTNMLVVLPIQEVFDFFSDAGKLEIITPPWLNFSILTPQPIEMREGALIDYKLKIRKIPIRWRTEICVWEPPFRFVDQQLKGPYSLWHHEHLFSEVEGGTLVQDRVTYRSPGGSLIHRFFVRPDLEKIFRFRQDKLRELFDDKIRQSSQSPVLTQAGVAEP